MTDRENLLAEESRLDAAERDLAEREGAARRDRDPRVLAALAAEREALAERRDAVAASLDEAAADRDQRAAQRDADAARRDREAREEDRDPDAGYAYRFLSARDVDEAVGDRADALADRRRALADRQRSAESRHRAAEDRERSAAAGGAAAPRRDGGRTPAGGGETEEADLLVAQAVGLVRGRRDIPAAEALRLLVVASATAGVSLPAMAALVVESGDLPAG